MFQLLYIVGEVLLKKQIHKSKDNDVIYHLTINHNGKLRFLEGQVKNSLYLYCAFILMSNIIP